MRRGLVEGFLSYLLWGLLPIYWKQLGDVAALDVVANRLVWTFVLLMGVHVARSTWRDLVEAAGDHRMMVAMLVSGLLLTMNWLVYIWAVDQDRVVDASLGYFINPLVAVFLGVVVLGERLPLVQWVAIVIAGLGVAWLTIDVGRLPWISLILAFSFGFYGLIRKTARVESFNGLTIEMGWFFVPALVFVIVRGIGGEPGAITEDAAVAPLLLLTGAVTAAPLLLFASAARRVPLATIGLLQYVAPTLQLIIGVWVYGEMFDGGQLIGFSLIWLALVVFTTDVMRRYFGRRSPAPVLQPAG
jgi:chloramphenicol-sensitive protein RarD